MATSTVTNLVGSGLVAYRLWTVNRRVYQLRVDDSRGQHSTRRVLHIILDSAALYSVTRHAHHPIPREVQLRAYHPRRARLYHFDSVLSGHHPRQ